MKSKKEKISVTLDASLVKALQDLAKEQNRNVSNMAEVVVYAGIAQLTQQRPK